MEIIENEEITATVKVDRILIPRIILPDTFNEGDSIGIKYINEGEIVLSKFESNVTYSYLTTLSTNNFIPIDPDVLNQFGINAGDAIEFKITKSTHLLVKKIDKKTSKSYLFPTNDKNKMPIPPGWLVQAFVGHPNVEQFLNSGYQTSAKIVELISDVGLDISKFNTILDFGCGCGRVLRGLPNYTKAKLLGCDLHIDAIDWSIENYNMLDFFYGTEQPPLNIENNQIDLLYAISVLTHLEESLQNEWLEEWKRIISPNGILIVTFRGEDFIDKYVKPSNPEYANKVYNEWKDNNGFSYIKHREWEGVFEGFYSDAYHTKQYIYDNWGKYFDIVKIINAGEFVNSNRQNVAIMRAKKN